MKLIASIFAILIVASAQVTAADFGGVVLGSQADARALEKLGIFSLDENTLSPGIHRGKTRFDYIDSNTEVTIDSAGRVAALKIDFHTEQATGILEIAIKKWGKPAESGKDIFDGHLLEVWIWKTRDGANITLLSYDPKYDTGSLTRGSLLMVTQANADAELGPKGGSL